MRGRGERGGGKEESTGRGERVGGERKKEREGEKGRGERGEGRDEREKGRVGGVLEQGREGKGP